MHANAYKTSFITMLQFQKKQNNLLTLLCTDRYQKYSNVLSRPACPSKCVKAREMCAIENSMWESARVRTQWEGQ